MRTRHIDGIAANDLIVVPAGGALPSPLLLRAPDREKHPKRGSLVGDYAASALRTSGAGFETTNRKEGRRRLGLTVRTAASNSLKALRFIVATLPLW